MADRPFVHLHCHTHYSLLDGASRVPELVQLTKSLGMNAIAMTDHGNLFGAIEFYKECTANGINPIVGYEAYVAPTHRTDRSMKKRGESGYHLTLLAQNVQGFHNLIKLASIAYLEGYHYIPRIDKEVLEAHSKGLICLSGCASSEFSDYILLDQMDKARETAIWFHKVFADNFYIEIQDNGLDVDIQRLCKVGAVDIANQLGLPLVATSDAHYLKQDDSVAHDILLCINTGRLQTDPNRMKYNGSFYVQSPEEMYGRFPGHEEAVKRSQEIANKCDIKLDFKKRHFPVFTPPEKKTPEAYLRELCEIGLIERYGPDAAPEAHARLEAAKARLEHELGIILRMGFAGYFLIVWDFVRFAISKNIPAGARGSACGAVVSYVLKLSHVCPLEYDLLFERFLDPNRSEAPDIDIDFCQEQREEVIKYVRERYGEASVAQIATFGTMAAKAAIKDVGRVMDVPLERVNRLTGMVPKVLNITLEDSLKQSPDLRREYDNDTEVRRLIDIAMKLEGTNRNVGTHAAGVVIANGPITDYVPVQRMQRKDGKEGAIITTQWVMGDLEKVGMLKMDFLGLRTLTVVENALKLIRKSRLKPRDERSDSRGSNPQDLEQRDPRTYELLKHGIDRIPLTDKKTYELLQRGDARGVFQLESDGIRELLKRMRPDNIRDLIATNALYRPGPLGGGMVDAYVNRKNGREKPVYAHPIMEEILAETYGVMCIHEDTRISLADGSEKPIKSVRRGDPVHSLNYQTNRFEIKDCHGCGPTRRGDGLHIVLENGFSVVLTPDHEVLTYEGLKKAETLDPKHDLVAVGLHLKQHSIPEGNIAPWLGSDVDVAYLIGLLIGDGCMTGDSPTLATGTKKNHDILVQWLRERLPKLRLHEYFHIRSWYVTILCPELLNQSGSGNRKTKLHYLLDTLGVKKSAHFKHIPSIIFQCESNVRASLLAGLFDSDGCLAQTNRGSGVCFLTSVSHELLHDVRRLCQLEAIPVMVRKNRIHLWNLERAAHLLEPFLLLKQFKGKLNSGGSIGWIPRNVIKQVIPAGESVRLFCIRTTIERSGLGHSFPFVKSSTAAKAGVDLGDVRYMQIVRIERVTDQQFYGMSVADHHNLVANGIVVKNCYQEQIMRILNKLGDIELSSAYACIKAISKKKEDIINARRVEFLAGANSKGVPEATAKEIFDLICFFGGYGFNKCVVAGTVIVNAKTGEITTVGELYENRRPFAIHALGDNQKMVARPVTDVVWNGRKKVFRLRTQLGKTITATANHPLRTLNGWTNLGELAVGDRIAVPRHLQIDAKESWPRHEIIALAGLISEGNTCHPSSLYFYGNDSVLVQDFAQAIGAFPETVARTTTRRRGIYEVCANTGRDCRFRPGKRRVVPATADTLTLRSGAFRWLANLGLAGQLATEKFVPHAVFQLPDHELGLFLGRLWAGDGFIANETLKVPFYATSSRQLAVDVQTLLLRFGIVSRIHEKQFRYRDQLRPGFTVHVLGADSIEVFLRQIMPHCLGREKAIAILQKYIETTERGLTSKDTIPAEVRNWVNEERCNVHLTWLQLEADSGVSMKEFLGKGSALKQGFRRSTIARLAKFFASKRLANLANSEIFWDRVESIEPSGIEDTYDLTVAVDHNFVADGIIVHNSHSAAYAKLGYQTAYLKTHYPAEFMAALLTSEIDDSNKRDIMVEHIDDARRLGSEVLPPNIQDGEAEFTVKNNKIVFGLLAIKGLGRGAAEEIVRARNDGGPFKDFFDFCERIDQKLVPKAGIERLIKVGTFDCTGAKRSQLWDALPGALQAASQAQDDRKHGQLNLFEVMDAGSSEAAPSGNDNLKNIPEWVPLEKLKYEKEALDFYISSHPLGQYEEALRRFSGAAAANLKSLDANSEVFIGGMLTVVRFMNTKKARNGNSRYARFKLEDFSGAAECVMWPDDYVKYADLVEEDKIVFIQAIVERKTDEPILQVTRVMSMEQGQLERTTGLVMVMDLTDSEDEDLRKMESIRNVLHRARGHLPVFLHMRDGGGKWLRMKVSDDLRINPTTINKADLETILGVGRVEFSRQGNGMGRG